MTDNEIIKALEFCKNISCNRDCPLFSKFNCKEKLSQNAFDLIQRQQKRIDRLKDNLDAVLKERADHTEAIEEFADKIVEQLEEASCYIEDGDGHAGHVVFTDKAIAIVKGVQNE